MQLALYCAGALPEGRCTIRIDRYSNTTIQTQEWARKSGLENPSSTCSKNRNDVDTKRPAYTTSSVLSILSTTAIIVVCTVLCVVLLCFENNLTINRQILTIMQGVVLARVSAAVIMRTNVPASIQFALNTKRNDRSNKRST